MVWALLANYLTRKPPWVQAGVVGLCVGLFATTAAEANQRNPLISSTVWLVVAWGVGTGLLFYLGLKYQERHGWVAAAPGPTWLSLVYAVIWLFGLATALFALFGAGGLKVAVLAIVPLVLLAPTALQGVRRLLRPNGMGADDPANHHPA